MEPLLLKKTEDTPEIFFNPENDNFFISERSLPENAIEFYQPVFNWLNDYFVSPNTTTIFDFKLEYYNTSTAKQLAKLLMLLEKHSVNHKITVRWHYDKEDADMKDSGARYAKLININFEFIEY